MASIVDEWITTPDDQQLFTKTWKPTIKPIADLLFIHGFGDHCARYDNLFQVFAINGIETHSYDQRGWGETGKRDHSFGDNQGYETTLKDINDAVHRVKHSDRPLFLMGHSMGGGLVLNYAARKEDGVNSLAGVIVSAPLVTLTHPFNWIKIQLLKAIAFVMPSVPFELPLNPEAMSHDTEQIILYKDDPLVHNWTTVGTVCGMIGAGTDLLTLGSNITLPILFFHGDADSLTSCKSTEQVYRIAASKDKEMKIWNQLRHELHQERQPDRDQVHDYYVNWIKDHI